MRPNATKFFVRNAFRNRAGKGGAQGIYRSLQFIDRFSGYTPGFIGAATAPKWVPYILPTSAAPTDDGGVRVAGFTQAAGFTVGDGIGTAYTISGGFAGQQTRSIYLATSDVSGGRFDTRSRWTASCTLTILDNTAPVIEGGLEFFIPSALPADKRGVKFLIGYDAGGFYGRCVDGINGGGQLFRQNLGINWVPYATLITLSLSCDGTNVAMSAGPPTTLCGTLPNVSNFLRGGTIGMHFNWNAATVDKAFGISNVRVTGATF